MHNHGHPQHDHPAHGEPAALSASHPRYAAHDDAHAGHEKHAGHSAAMFRNKFWLTLLLAIPTVVWSGMIQQWFGFAAPRFAGSAYVPAVFGTVVYFYGGWPFLHGGYRELRDRLPGMMTLIWAAFFLTIVAIASAALTAVLWPALGRPWGFTMERVVTVLVIACPHALGLAIPLVVAISTTLGARHGLLVRDRRGLEDARNVNAVFFDKTGTLTRGEFRVGEVTTDDGLAPDEALALAAAAEYDSEHTIARGIVKSAEERSS
jgi:cation transport ATPase